jgi:phosphomannomutase
MNRHRRSAAWPGTILGTILGRTKLGTVCALLALSLAAHASDHRGALTEEFHQTYALTADGRIELDNINGDVHISSWDQNEVKVDAVKYGGHQRALGRGED